MKKKCPRGYKLVKVCPSDVAAAETPAGQSFPYPEVDRYGLGAEMTMQGHALELTPAEVQVVRRNGLGSLRLSSARLWVPNRIGTKPRVNMELRDLRSNELFLTCDPKAIRAAVAQMTTHNYPCTWGMHEPGKAQGEWAVEVKAHAVPQLLVWLDSLEERGLAGLGEVSTPKCARGEVPVCTPRHAVPGLMGASGLNAPASDRFQLDPNSTLVRDIWPDTGRIGSWMPPVSASVRAHSRQHGWSVQQVLRVDISLDGNTTFQFDIKPSDAKQDLVHHDGFEGRVLLGLSYIAPVYGVLLKPKAAQAMLVWLDQLEEERGFAGAVR